MAKRIGRRFSKLLFMAAGAGYTRSVVLECNIISSDIRRVLGGLISEILDLAAVYATAALTVSSLFSAYLLLEGGLLEATLFSFSAADNRGIQEQVEQVGRCVICHWGITVGSRAWTPFFHTFHSHCIRTWLEHTDVCPVCRSDVAGISISEVPGATLDSVSATAAFFAANNCGIQGSEQVEDCAICLEDITVGPRTWTPCFHTFHSHCIQTWLGYNNFCPVCRSYIPTSH